MIDVQLFGDQDVRALLKGMEDQIPFATALTLTRTAKDVQQAEQGHLKGVLDRPTRFTIQSIRVKPATKRDLEARIWIRDEATKGTAPAQYLAPLIRGGSRDQKRHEKALQMRGILPTGWFTVPGKDARTNRFGNLTAGTYTKILSQLQASPDAHQNASKRRGYFVLRKGKGQRPIGVYQRTGKRTIKSILHFVRSVDYGRRIYFDRVAQKVINRRLDDNMMAALEQTIRSAGKKSASTSRAGVQPLRSASIFGFRRR